MAEASKKSRKNVGKGRKAPGNVRRIASRTDLLNKLVRVYRSCGIASGDLYKLSVVEKFPTMYNALDKIAKRERARIIERKEKKEAKTFKLPR